MKKLIGIAAKARSGKDTVAKYLFESYGFTRIAFADPVKLAAQAIFGLSHDATWNDDIKETTIPYWGLSPRRMFQLVGTECVKPHFGKDVWIKRWNVAYNTLKETDDIVVPDVRFEEEAAYLRSIGGRILHLSRPGVAPVSDHVSEAGIDKCKGDLLLVNDGTIQDLYNNLDKLVEML